VLCLPSIEPLHLHSNALNVSWCFTPFPPFPSGNLLFGSFHSSSSLFLHPSSLSSLLLSSFSLFLCSRFPPPPVKILPSRELVFVSVMAGKTVFVEDGVGSAVAVLVRRVDDVVDVGFRLVEVDEWEELRSGRLSARRKRSLSAMLLRERIGCLLWLV
jgi:hypothetical protein